MKRCPVLVREVAHLDAALRYVRQHRTAVDGGAHVGLWTERMAESFECVVAVEPWPAHAQEIRDRVPSAEVVEAALGEREGVVYMEAGADNDGQHHIGVVGKEVRLMPLDALGLDDVALLKLDVEGYELMALRGAEATIARSHPVVIIEENGLCRRYGVGDGDAGRWLQARGYRMAGRLNKDEVWVPVP